MSYQANCSFPDSTYSSSNKPQADTLKADIAELESKHNSHDSDTSLHNTLSTIYPIGCIYVTTISTNPATIFGFGTWATYGAGKVMVGVDSTDTDFDTAEETSGSKTINIAHTHTGPSHTHTGPSHTHTGTVSSVGDHSHTINDHSHTYSGSGTTGAASTVDNNVNTGDENAPKTPDHTHGFSWSGTTSGASDRGTSSAGGHNHTFTSDGAGTGATGADGTGNTGSSLSATQSVVQPSIATYFFKRTA